MKHLVSLVLVIFTTGVHAEELKPILRVMNWSYYIALDDQADESLSEVERSPTLQRFMRENNCIIEYLNYESEDELNRYMALFPNKLDVINTNHHDAAEMGKSGILEVLNEDKVPNKKDLDPYYISSLKPEELRYVVPFLAGNTGILYRRDLVEKQPTTWKDLFYPSKEIHGKINLLNTHTTTFLLALHALDKDVTNIRDADVKEAARLIYEMRKQKQLDHISSDIDLIVEKLNNGQLAMTPMYLGDALGAIEEDEQNLLAFVVPKEGGETYIDCWAVSKNSKQKDLAIKFVNFILEPEVIAENAAYLSGACPSKRGMKVLREKYPASAADRAVYPEREASAVLRYEALMETELSLMLWKKVTKAAP